MVVGLHHAAFACVTNCSSKRTSQVEKKVVLLVVVVSKFNHSVSSLTQQFCRAAQKYLPLSRCFLFPERGYTVGLHN